MLRGCYKSVPPYPQLGGDGMEPPCYLRVNNPSRDGVGSEAADTLVGLAASAEDGPLGDGTQLGRAYPEAGHRGGRK